MSMFIMMLIMIGRAALSLGDVRSIMHMPRPRPGRGLIFEFQDSGSRPTHGRLQDSNSGFLINIPVRISVISGLISGFQAQDQLSQLRLRKLMCRRVRAEISTGGAGTCRLAIVSSSGLGLMLDLGPGPGAAGQIRSLQTIARLRLRRGRLRAQGARGPEPLESSS